MGVLVDEICHRAVTCEVAHLGTNCTHHTYYSLISEGILANTLNFNVVATLPLLFIINITNNVRDNSYFKEIILTSKRLAN